ncbi:MAG: cytochrome c [Gammaproteobacteria bacterium]
MSMMKLLTATLVMMLTASTPAGSETLPADTPNLGQAPPAGLVEHWNLSVFADGRGLPDGQGSVSTGRNLYEQHCMACHAVDGSGGSGDRLAQAGNTLTDEYPDKTVGNFWPYATTLFDFIRRSKPMTTPGSLTDDEVYALTGYVLFLNDLVTEDTVINKSTLPQIEMPNRDGFVDAWANEPMNQ